jgi:hypothetical protein
VRIYCRDASKHESSIVMPSDGPVTGAWSRGQVESQPTKDGKRVDWNRTAGLTRVTLPADQASKISASNPRTCGLVVNGPYTPDSGGVSAKAWCPLDRG